MTLDEMIQDFCKRALTEYTPKQVKGIMKNNYSIILDDGFIVFNFVYEECHGLFCYVIPGKDGVFKNLMKAMESMAKRNGCKKILFVTKRSKPLLKILKDYKISDRVVIERELK